MTESARLYCGVKKMDKVKSISFDSKISVIKKRDSNLELFRIITMLLIVAHHFVVNSGLMADDGLIYSSPFSVNSIFLLLLGAWGKTGINCFVMITGYFMCKSNITLNKYLKLLFEIYFYRISISLIFWITKYESFSVNQLIDMLLPVKNIGANFTGCFIMFYLFIPFINILINAMNKKQHIGLLILCFVTYVLFGTVHKINFNYVSWLMIIYLFAAYIRFYPNKFFETKKIGWLLLGCIFLSSTSVVASLLLGNRLNKTIAYYFVQDSNSFLPFVTGICAFLFFKNIKIRYSSIINAAGASTFGVLLIHANSDTMRQWLWVDLLKNTEMYSSAYMPLYAVVCAIGIFVVCVVIDQLRINFIEKPFFKCFSGKIQNISDSVRIRIENVVKKYDIK